MSDIERVIKYLETLSKLEIIQYLKETNFDHLKKTHVEDITSMREPKIHSHITDVLDEDDPLANETILCPLCGSLVHCAHNECMQTWIQTGIGNYCFDCFVRLDKDGLARLNDTKIHDVLEDEFGLEIVKNG